MHVHAPYGEERYFPVFEAAVRHRLPVAIHGDGSGGIEMPPTMAGLAHHFVEYHTLFPLNGIIHLGSMVSEGLFDRLPDLRVVFTDGGFAVFTPLLWREDAKARALKDEMPWVAGRPSEYLRQNVRFVLRRDDIPGDAANLQTALDLAHASETLLYGSNYPMWDMVEREPAPVPDGGGLREAFFGQTALALYPRLNG
jgi:predicted TIM-barrel fold metal-dependent hydrolase